MGSPSKREGESRDEVSAPAGSSPKWEGPLDTAIMFVDLVDSSVFASVLGLKEYSDYVESFHEVVRVQCEHFLSIICAGSMSESGITSTL